MLISGHVNMCQPEVWGGSYDLVQQPMYRGTRHQVEIVCKIQNPIVFINDFGFQTKIPNQLFNLKFIDFTTSKSQYKTDNRR